ncbi:hypothetical protein ACYSNR_14900 [Enterococcus sp. LJL128]
MNEYMKEMGFMKYEASSDIVDDPFPPVMYERKLSLQTSLIVEGEAHKTNIRYEYSFYKIEYDYKTNAIRKIKPYLSGSGEKYTLERVLGWLEFVKMLPEGKIVELRNQINTLETVKPRKRYNQKSVDNRRKQKLGVL